MPRALQDNASAKLNPASRLILRPRPFPFSFVHSQNQFQAATLRGKFQTVVGVKNFGPRGTEENKPTGCQRYKGKGKTPDALLLHGEADGLDED
jgi:hypothetical protein